MMIFQLIDYIMMKMSTKATKQQNGEIQYYPALAGI